MYNADEEAKDITQGRAKVLGSKCEAARLFDLSDGDKTPWHITNMQTTRADGMFQLPGFSTEGAPPSLVIHSNPGVEEPRITKALIANVVCEATAEQLALYKDSPYLKDGFVNARNCVSLSLSLSLSRTRRRLRSKSKSETKSKRDRERERERERESGIFVCSSLE